MRNENVAEPIRTIINDFSKLDAQTAEGWLAQVSVEEQERIIEEECKARAGENLTRVCGCEISETMRVEMAARNYAPDDHLEGHMEMLLSHGCTDELAG